MQKNSELPQEELNYSSIKLINGDELITRTLFEDEKNLVVDNPYLVIKDIETSKIFLIKWIITTKNTIFNIDKNHILAYDDADDKIIDYYNYRISQELIYDEIQDNEYASGTIH